MIFFKHPRFRRVFFSLVLASVEAFLAFACLVAGIPILINPGVIAPTSVLALLPLPAVYAWAAGLTSGGTLALLGIILSEERIERMGVLALATTTGVYSFALIALFPGTLMVFILYGFFSLAMFARYWVLGRLIVARRSVTEGG